MLKLNVVIYIYCLIKIYLLLITVINLDTSYKKIINMYVIASARKLNVHLTISYLFSTNYFYLDINPE